MEENKFYKYCIVPQCGNTSFKCSNYLFIRVPEDKRRKTKWIKACRRSINDFSKKNTKIYVCEDHFNLEEDMENYVKFKLIGGKIKMKANVVPHIFVCQPNRKRVTENPPREASIKRARKRDVEEALALSAKAEENVLLTSDETETINKTYTEGTSTMTNLVIEKRNVGIQVQPRVKNMSTQCKIPGGISIALSPIKQFAVFPSSQGSSSSISFVESSSSNTVSISNYSQSSHSSTACSYSFSSEELQEFEENKKKEFKMLSLKCTLMKLQNRPRLYLGLSEHAFYTVNLLEKYSKLDATHILLTLKKIRTSDSFISLADDFGTSESNASRIFLKTLPRLCKLLRKCIINPQPSKVKFNLPLAFRARYFNVYCIIDCLEIEIEKPSDAVKQSLTWSEYKKCNTLKYLISSTPDGIVNFISTGFGGRASDAVIVENCGFLEILPENVLVMADRGFKHIEHLLIKKKCRLIRPPSLPQGTKLTKDEVLETKKIASLRIHIERVVRRVREYSLLEPHSCIDNKLIKYADNVIKVVCGLINLQSALITGV